MIKYEEAVKEGLKVVEIAVARFYVSNTKAYNLYGFEQKDLEGYVHETILVRRFLRSIEETPEFYKTINNFKSSLYVSSRKACLAHFRRITAKKRADAFREGALVAINQEDRNGNLPMFEGDALQKPTSSSDMVIKAMANELSSKGECLAARIFLCCVYRHWRRKDVETRFPNVPEDTMERVFYHLHHTLSSK